MRGLLRCRPLRYLTGKKGAVWSGRLRFVTRLGPKFRLSFRRYAALLSGRRSGDREGVGRKPHPICYLHAAELGRVRSGGAPRRTMVSRGARSIRCRVRRRRSTRRHACSHPRSKTRCACWLPSSKKLEGLPICRGFRRICNRDYSGCMLRPGPSLRADEPPPRRSRERCLLQCRR
jgi:hypothetical protein